MSASLAEIEAEAIVQHAGSRFVDPTRASVVKVLCARRPAWVAAVLGRTPAPGKFGPLLYDHELDLLYLADQEGYEP